LYWTTQFRTEPHAVRSKAHAVRTEPHTVGTEPDAVRTKLDAVCSKPHAVRVQPHTVRTEPHAARTKPHSVRPSVTGNRATAACSVRCSDAAGVVLDKASWTVYLVLCKYFNKDTKNFYFDWYGL